MAIKTVVTVFDDIDGSEGASPIGFTFNGVQYEIDLNDKNLTKMGNALAPYIEKARKVGRVKGSRPSGERRSAGGDSQAIREWARGQGMEVGEKGRIPLDLLDKYKAAQAGGAADAPKKTAAPRKRTAKAEGVTSEK